MKDKKKYIDNKRKRGNKAGFIFFDIVYKILGLKGCYFFLYIVVPYYLFFDRKAVLSLEPYLTRRFPDSHLLTKYYHTFNVFVKLGKYLLDRYVYMINESVFNISLDKQEIIINELKSTNKGIVILTSHIGNWQLVIKTLKHLERTVHVVMRKEDSPAAQKALRLYSEQGNVKIITPREDNFGGIIDMLNALKKGDIVAIAGDRSYGTDVLDVNFLNDTAFFPYSGIKLAAENECPVAILLTSHIKNTTYSINLNNILYPKYTEPKNKTEQLRPWIQKYADVISCFLEKNPYDCFIFYDIWKK